MFPFRAGFEMKALGLLLSASLYLLNYEKTSDNLFLEHRRQENTRRLEQPEALQLISAL